MFEESINLNNYDFNNIRLYLFTTLFTFGNVILPILFHQLNLGGHIFLPIYFFTLIGTYKFGYKTGLGIAILTPLVNHFLTGMPVISMVPIILFKGMALVFATHIVLKNKEVISIKNLLLIVILYQLLGAVFEFVLFLDITRVINTVLVAWPGLLIQIFAGYALIKSMKDYE